MAELVGRDHELDSLLGLLDDARSRRGRAALVLGDAGIGKTRLTEAFAATAAATAITVAWGRCTEAEAPPYWPWRQGLRALRGTVSRLGELATKAGYGSVDILPIEHPFWRFYRLTA